MTSPSDNDRTAPEAADARVPGLPVIFDDVAMGYGHLTVRQHDDGRLEAVGDVPERCAFSRDLLESGETPALTWDDGKITVTLSNGSWTWHAEAQHYTGRIIYGAQHG